MRKNYLKTEGKYEIYKHTILITKEKEQNR